MHIRNVVKAVSGFTLALVLGTPLLAAGPANSLEVTTTSNINWYAPERASTLLRQLRELNVDISKSGDNLETFTNSHQIKWQSHAFYLSNLRGNINQAGDVLGELQSIRHGALPWQQQAIDRIVPVAVDLAAHTQAAIVHLRENQNRLMAPEYTGHLTAIADRATEMREMVKNFVDYGETQKTMRQHQESLELGDSQFNRQCPEIAS